MPRAARRGPAMDAGHRTARIRPFRVHPTYMFTPRGARGDKGHGYPPRPARRGGRWGHASRHCLALPGAACAEVWRLGFCMEKTCPSVGKGVQKLGSGPWWAILRGCLAAGTPPHRSACGASGSPCDRAFGVNLPGGDRAGSVSCCLTTVRRWAMPMRLYRLFPIHFHGGAECPLSTSSFAKSARQC